jgi:hypothetical protein
MEAYMRVHNPGSSSIFIDKSIKSTVSHNQVNKNQGSSSLSFVQSEKKIDKIVPYQELISLASDLKNGLIDRDKAKDRFVSMVTNSFIQDKLSNKDKEKMIEYISQFFSHDPSFMIELEKNLSNLLLT